MTATKSQQQEIQFCQVPSQYQLITNEKKMSKMRSGYRHFEEYRIQKIYYSKQINKNSILFSSFIQYVKYIGQNVVLSRTFRIIMLLLWFVAVTT